MRTLYTAKDGSRKKLTPVVANALQNLQSVIQSRAALAVGLGQSYGGDRDIYTALGYKKTLDFSDYWNMYSRGDIAARIVNAYPDATWRDYPLVYETEDPQNITIFESKWKEVEETVNLYHYLTRADRLAGIGQYAVVFVGFSDGKDPKEPVAFSQENRILYFQPFSQYNAPVNTWEKDVKNPRYGLPLTYKLKTASMEVLGGNPVSTVATKDIVVHYSRILHVADGLLESNVYGTPRLEAVFNRIMNLDLVAGGSAEMFWRGAFPGYSFEMDPLAELDPQDVDDLKDEIENFVHNLTRYLKLKGIKANTLGQEVASPKDHVDTLLKLIAGATGIPERILTGSERGELASTQDRDNWTTRVQERRNLLATPFILRPLIQMLITSGVLPQPAKLFIEWPNPEGIGKKDLAEIGQKRATALQSYVTSGSETVVPPKAFLVQFLGFTEDEAEAMVKEMEETARDEDRDRPPEEEPPAPEPGNTDTDEE